ncbi:MAG: hypothetical protein DI629_14550 [Mesorhizobium amorphae]|nr:MAG: hypothetical protein DI629_14550 [Mesorhizobium amorphae]
MAAKTVDRDGLVAVPVEVRNSGTTPILCQAEIAHWFAMDLARIAPDETVSLDLRFSRPTGTWAAINARGEALPVERAWCGVEGRTFETRWNLKLGRDAPQPLQLDCRADTTGLHCR